jgi:branched-chain amino acid transport system substrate-binding protein
MFKLTRLSAFVALTFSLGLSSHASADLVIGVAGPVTGLAATLGDQMWRGVEQAAKDINANGGVNGEQIRLVRADDACEPKQAVAVANKLVDADHIDAVVGHLCSSSTIPASEVYDDAGIISITPGSTNAKVTERGLQYIFRMCGRDDQQGIVAGDYIVDKLKATKVAFIHDKDSYGQGLADATLDQIKKRGLKEVMYEGVTRGEKDFSAVVTKLRQSGAEVVYFGGQHAEGGPLIRQIREQGLHVNILVGDALATSEFVSTVGGAQYASGVYMTFGVDPRNSAAGKVVIDGFRAKGYEPEGFTLYSYAALQALSQGFEGAKSKKSDDVSKWMKSHTIQTVMGPKNFDAKGDLTSSGYVMYQWSGDGSYKQL